MPWASSWRSKLWLRAAVKPIVSSWPLMPRLTIIVMTGSRVRDVLGPVQGLLPEPVEGDDLVHHPELERLGRGDWVAPEQQLLRFASAHLPCVSHVLDSCQTHPGSGIGELGVVGRKDQVARPAEHHSGCHALPLHGGDRRLRELRQAIE